MKCYQWVNGANGVYQPDCSGEQCPKWWRKNEMCLEVVNTLNIKSIQWNAEHKGVVVERHVESPTVQTNGA